MMRNLFNFFNHSTAEPKLSKQQGQGLAEYIIIIALVGIAVIAVVGVMTPAISDTFKRLIDANAVAPPSIAGYTPPAPTSANPTAIPSTYLLTVNTVTDSVGNGSTSLTGQSSQPSGQQVSIEAIPDAGSEFIGWEGDASGVVNPISIMMDGDKVVAARFQVKCYDLVAVPIGAGTILQDPAPNCPHGGSDYKVGTAVELRAAHDSTITFHGWSGSLALPAPLDEIINITINDVDKDIHIEATFDIVCYTLVVDAPNGHGSVIANPEPQCADGTARYTSGQAVTLNPQPDQGYEFDRWEGDLNNSIVPGIIVMDRDMNVDMYYLGSCLSLTTSVSGDGVVNVTSPSVPNCADGVRYLVDTLITVEAVPTGVDAFTFWTGPVSGDNPIANFTITGNSTVQANFGSCYPLTISTIGAGSIITPTTPNCVGGNSTWYARDTVVEIIADPDQEYDLRDWSGDASSTDRALYLTMDAAKSVVANFEACYTLSTSVTGNGSASDTGTICSTNSSKYKPQSLTTLTASPGTGYQFSSWSGDLVSSDNPADINMSQNQAVVANFALCDEPPSPWDHRDVGTVATAGGTCYDNGTFTINGSGDNIYYSDDEFQYAYQPFDGNGYIIARVISQQNTSGYAKAGVMIRNDLADDSRHAFTAVTPERGTRLIYRASTGGNSSLINNTGFSAPIWVKLERRGNTFISYRSSDGSNWIEIGRRNVTMSSAVYVGLAVTAQNDGTLSEVLFDNVEIQMVRQMTVEFAGTGSGVVNLNLPSVDCTADCIEVYSNGNNVALTATADYNATFAGWSGDTGCGSSVTINSDMTCIATFNRIDSIQTFEVSVSNSSDDAEEDVDDGSVDLSSSDLEMVMESTEQIVGVRFRNVTVPAGAIVTNAYLVFTTDETDTIDTSLTIHGEDIGDAPTFTTGNSDISSRTTTTASASWRNIPAWDAVGVQEQTANLKDVVQEIIARGDWTDGNSMAFIISGSGKRVADSTDGTAAVLHIEYKDPQITDEDFESNDWAGGTGDWSSDWSHNNDASLADDQTPYDNYHLHLVDDGYAERVSDLSNYADASLQFDWKARKLNGVNDEFYVEIYDGFSWTRILTVTLNSANYQDNVYAPYAMNLGTSYMVADFRIRFSGVTANGSQDHLYADNIIITELP